MLATAQGSSDIRANGALVSLDTCTLVSSDLINITSATVVNGIMRCPTINASRTAANQTITGVTMAVNQVTGLNEGRFVSGMDFSAQLGTVVRLDYLTANATTTLEGLLGTGYTVDTGDTLDLRNTGTVSTVTITVEEQDILSGVSGMVAGDTSANINGFIYTIPAIPPEDRTFTIPSTLAGKYIIQTGSTLGAVQTKAAGSPLVVIDTDNEQNVDYKIWWNPTSSWSGNAADAPVIYDYSYAAWNPSTMASSSSIADFQPDPSSAVTGAATATTAVTFTPTTGGTLSSGVAEFTITSAAATYGAAQAQTLAWQVQNSDLYLLAIATADLDGTSRIIEFGSGDSTTYNSGGDLIRYNATGTQRILGASGGFLSTALGPVMSVISADIITVAATLAQVAQASEVQINAVGNELKANQEKLSTDVRLASQLRPASGTVPNTSS